MRPHLSGKLPPDPTSEQELRDDCRKLLGALRAALVSGASLDLEDRHLEGGQWSHVRSTLADLARLRARRGFSPTETATLVLSLKQPLVEGVQDELRGDPARLVREIGTIHSLVDGLALLAVEHGQKSREDVIARQQQEMLELSTPVIELWEGILALPLIGTLDSARTQIVMETLLQRIVETGSSIAILDVTGVPTVDTQVAQHLLKTVAAARLMGAECIVSGIRPQIAQTIVQLGVELADVVTRATLADAFAVALERSGRSITSA